MNKRPMTKEESLEFVDNEIDRLLDKLARKGLCPYSVGSSLMYRGAFLIQDQTSDKDALEALDGVAELIVARTDIVLPANSTAH